MTTTIRQNPPAQADRLQGLQPPEEVFKNPIQLTFMRTLIDILRRALREMVSSQSAAPQVLLTSPNGTVFKITVSDAGAIVVTNARA
jgi:hypothetical protein